MISIWLCIPLGCNLNRLDDARESLNAHDLASAELQYRSILEKDPQQTEALAGLGWTYHLALKREDALRQFAYCLGVEPNNVECIRGKSSVLLSQGESSQSRLWLDKALSLSPDDPEALVSDAIWKLSQGEITKASVQLSLVIRRFPKRGKYRLPYAEALLREGKTKEALREVETGLNLDLPKRTIAMMWILRARILLEISASAGEDCEQIDAIEAWVNEADRSIKESVSTGVEVPNSGMIQRQLQRRRTTLQEICPYISTESQ